MTTITTGITVAIFIATLIAQWKIFEKMGEKGWKGLIPIYGSYKIFDRVWTGSAFLGMLALEIVSSVLLQCSALMTGPAIAATILASAICFIAGLVINFKFCGKLSRAFGHGKGFTALTFFMQPVAYMIYGFGGDSFAAEA